MNKLRSSPVNVRFLALTGMLSALAAVLMVLEFSVPFMPFFVKFDFSELPSLIASYCMGPLYGVAVCLIKNLVHLPMTQTGGIGELCNFLLGCAFVLPVGIACRFRRSRSSLILFSLLGTSLMALVSLPLNYFVSYPIYAKLMPLDEIISLYQQIFPGADGLFQCLLIFNLPFTFLKGLVTSLLVFSVSHPLSLLMDRLRK